jgi:hypothetical protein
MACDIVFCFFLLYCMFRTHISITLGSNHIIIYKKNRGIDLNKTYLKETGDA